MKPPPQATHAADASHLRAYMEYAVGDFVEAGRALQEALAVDPDNPAFHFDYGITQAAAGRWHEAGGSFERVLKLQPQFVDAVYNLAVTESILGNRQASATHFRQAVKFEPFLLYRLVSRHLRLADGANALLTRSAWPIPTRGVPEVQDLISLGFLKRGELAKAEEVARRALALAPTGARYGALGEIFHRMGRLVEARDAFARALTLEPNLEEAKHHLAIIAFHLRDYSDARTRYDRLILSNPNDLFSLSRLLMLDTLEGRLDEAEARFKRIVRLAYQGGLKFLSWEALSTIAYRAIMWPLPPAMYRIVIEAINTQIEDATKRRGAVLPPRVAGNPKSRIRIGYLSASFRDHPIGHVTAELFRAHDKSRFEVHVFFAAPFKFRPYTYLIEEGVEHFHHVPGKISEVAMRIFEQDLDVLIYLDGYMEHRLLQVVAMRPAPLQIYWLGHAGGCEISAMDYMIADEIVVPRGEEGNYRPAVIRLPDTYHCASSHHVAKTRSRSDDGLPESGFVFTGFNNPEKIDRTICNAWMRILKAVPSSVLWLSRGPTATFQTNMKAEFEKFGINPDRLIFADRAPHKADHLARLRHCSLLLDTITLNASTTALDALWAGVPVLTIYGDRFASRIASSMLKAIGLDDMICHSLDEYERRAVHLATTPAALAEVRERLRENLKTRPLFDIQRFCRNIENALEAVVVKNRGQIPPAFDAESISSEMRVSDSPEAESL